MLVNNSTLLARLKLLQMGFLVSIPIIAIYAIVRTKFTLSLFSDMEPWRFVEIGLSIFCIFEFGLVGIVYALSKYKIKSLNIFLTAQILRLGIIEAIACNGLVLALLGSQGSIKYIMLFAALINLIIQYPTHQRVDKWEKAYVIKT
jgi:hypothetical protein